MEHRDRDSPWLVISRVVVAILPASLPWPWRGWSGRRCSDR